MPLVGPENTLGEGHLLGPGVATIAGMTGTGQETAKQVIGETSATDVASVAILSATAATVQGQTAARLARALDLPGAMADLARVYPTAAAAVTADHLRGGAAVQ